MGSQGPMPLYGRLNLETGEMISPSGMEPAPTLGKPKPKKAAKKKATTRKPR